MQRGVAPFFTPMKLIARAVAFSILLGASCSAERIVIVAGGGTAEQGVNATECRLREPFGAEFAPDGAMVIVEMTKGNRVLKIEKKGILTVLAGDGSLGFSGDGGPAARATFNGLHTLAIGPTGDIYLADAFNFRVRKIEAKSGMISTFAGVGKKGFGGDGGPATQAQFGSTINVALDPAGRHLYVADIDNRRVRRITLENGVVDTVAGNGSKGIPADGARATEAPLVDPRAVAATATGGVYILERSGHALRLVDQDGRIRTVAGTGEAGFSGDGEDARHAKLNGPKHLCVDLKGDVLIADTDNHVIRKLVVGDGRIVRVAGNGKKGAQGVGGSPLEVELNQPHGVSVDRDGTITICDSLNDRVLRIVR
jgi:DNA-binding beta-propeller fold protein YncE